MIGNEIGVSGLRAPDSDLSFPKVHTDVCNIAELLQSQLSSGAAGTQGTKPTQGTPAGPRRRGGGASGPAPGVWGTASGRQHWGHTSLPQPPLGPSPAACRVPPGLRACPGPMRPVVPDSSSVRCAGGLLWSSPPARGGTPPVRPPPPCVLATHLGTGSGCAPSRYVRREPEEGKQTLPSAASEGQVEKTLSGRRRVKGGENQGTSVSFAGGPHGRDRGSLSPSDHVPGRVPGRVPAPGRAAGAQSRAGRPGSDQREQRCSPFLQRTLTELRQEPRARTGTDMALCRHHGPPVGVAFPLRVGLFLSKCRRFILWTRSPRSDRM